MVGDSLNPIVDAIRSQKGIEWVHVRNEEAGALAASAEAQLTGRLAVCAGSSGPGNTHLIQGLYDANRTGAAVLAMASHIPTGQVGTSYFQETRPERLFIDASVWCETLSGADQMPRMLRSRSKKRSRSKEFRSSSSPAMSPSSTSSTTRASTRCVVERGRVLPPPSQLHQLADAINDDARRSPCSVAPACAARTARSMALAEAVKAPIGHSLRGKEWIQFDNPYDVGMTGLLGYGACHDAIHEADLLVLLGTDLPYDSFLPGRRTAQVDDNAAHLGRRTPRGRGARRRTRDAARPRRARGAEAVARPSSTTCCSDTSEHSCGWSTRTPATAGSARRSIPSMSPTCSTISRPTTRSSPSTPA